jgi:predicted ATPase/DNA-binding CsgD family transcriptional regulator
MGEDTEQWLFDPLTDRELEILRYISDGKSDREIAQQLYLSLNTVKWHNRQIYNRLGVANRKQAVARARGAGLLGTPPGEVIAPARHNLPVQITSFVGRRREIDEIRRLLEDVHLLTLTGPPGTGKTRLALHVAAGLLDDFTDGIFFIDLAPIRDPQLVAITIANALGVRETGELSLIETLKSYLRGKHLLLLLDNFEQVIDAAPLVGELLSASAGLKTLVTSREVLNLYGEHEYPVSPLELPDPDCHEPLAELSQRESSALFVQRAQSASQDFHLTAENAPAVAEICLRLDGLPLALELAAARSKLLPPRMLLDRLADCLGTLTGGPRGLYARQQTLRGAIDWSYDLLDDDEKVLFARLGVFQGGCDIEAAQAVCGHNLSLGVLDGLESLWVKSLLRREEGPGGRPRFTMLETIHEYARERLEGSGEAVQIRWKHAEYLVTLAETARPELEKANHQYWTERLTADHENIRAALAWSLGDGRDYAELGLRLASCLEYFWFFTGHGREGEGWLRRALEIAGNAAPAVRANVLAGLSMLLGHRNDLEESKVCAREALRLYTQAGDRFGRARSLMWLSGAMIGNPHECGSFPGGG